LTVENWQTVAYSYGESLWPGRGDVTALGWAQLIRMYATRERDAAVASAAAASAAGAAAAAASTAAAEPQEAVERQGSGNGGGAVAAAAAAWAQQKMGDGKVLGAGAGCVDQTPQSEKGAGEVHAQNELLLGPSIAAHSSVVFQPPLQQPVR